MRPFSCSNLASFPSALDEDWSMRVFGILATIAIVVTLGACETTSPAQQRAADDTRCRSFGFKRGTDAFSKCLLDLDLNRSADRRAAREELMLYSGPRFYGAPYWRYW
jgi:hypothetical protein